MTRRREKLRMFKRVRLATAMMLVCALSLAMLLAGCEGDSSTSTTSTDQPLNQVTGPVGSVTGTVLDTNGHALEGVTVGLAGKTTTTNATGQYVFENVQVAYTMGADQHEHPNPFVIKVNAPAGYLGATVTVDVFAQFDGSNDYTGDQSVVSEGNNKTVTLVDGFMAQAGMAVLPELATTVKGWLRNCDTGEPVANATVALDLWSVALNGGFAIPSVDGTQASHESQTYMATTGADGMFQVTGVPADSMFNLSVPDYYLGGFDNAFFNNIDTAVIEAKSSNSPINIVTTFDEAGINLGESCATKITSGDHIKPVVKRVNSVVGLAVCLDCAPTLADNASVTPYRAILKKGVDGTTGIQVVFSEAMANVTADDILLRDPNGTYITDFTAAMSGNTLTITLASPLAEGQYLDVILDRNAFTDLSGNMLDDSDDVGYDYALSTGGTACGDAGCIPFLKLCLAAYQAPSVVVGDVVGTQVCDSNSSNNADLDSVYGGVFTDCCGSLSGYQQLNGSTDRSSDPTEVAYQLSLLGSALTGSSINVNGVAATIANPLAQVGANYAGDVTSYNGGWAAITFTPAPGVDVYQIGTSGSVNTACNSADNLCGWDGEDVVYVDDTSKDAKFAVSGVKVGQKVTITPLDSFGYPGSTFSITLNDCAKPTVALQTAYGVCNTTNGLNALVAYGSGAELSDEGVAGTFASIIYPVTPRMLGRQEAQPWDGTAATNGVNPAAGLDEPVTIYDLYTLNGVCDATAPDSDKCGIWDGSVATAVNMAQDSLLNNLLMTNTPRWQNLYDATAFAAYAPSRRLGLAVTEDLSAVDGTQVSYDGSVTLDNFNFLNDIANQDTYNADGATNTPPAEIVLFDSSNILDFANLDHGSIIDMTGAMTDKGGNVSDDATTTDLNRPSGPANAKVAVYDRMPPFVTRAFYGDADGNATNELVIAFNEPIVVPVNGSVSLWAPNTGTKVVIPLTPVGVSTLDSGVTLSADRLTLTVAQTALPAGFSTGTLFPVDTNAATVPNVYAIYDEAAYDDVVSAGTDLPHGILTFDLIEDDLGNSWDDYFNGNSCTPSELVIPPAFAAVDASVIQNLEVGVQTQAGVGSIAPGVTGTQTFTWTANQPVDWATMFGVSYNATTGAIATPASWFGYGSSYTTGLVGTTTTDATAVAAQVVDAQTLRVTFNITTATTVNNFFGVKLATIDPAPLAGEPGVGQAGIAWVWSSAWTSADPATELEQVREYFPALQVQ